MGTIIHGIIFAVRRFLFQDISITYPWRALAAILLLVGYKLSKFSLYQGMYKLGKDQFIPFIVTMIAILSTDLLKGIAIGMVVAIFLFSERTTNILIIT